MDVVIYLVSMYHYNVIYLVGEERFSIKLSIRIGFKPAASVGLQAGGRVQSKPLTLLSVPTRIQIREIRNP